MRLEQYIGPFKTNQILFNKKNVSYLQLGIEHPHSIPLSELEDFNDNSHILIGIYTVDTISNQVPAISQKDFLLSEKDILEFKLNGYKNVAVIIRENKNNPYLIINAAYEDAT